MGLFDEITKTVEDATKAVGDITKMSEDVSKAMGDAMDSISTLAGNVSDGISNAIKSVTDSAAEWNNERIRNNEIAEQEEAKRKERELEVASGFYEENGSLIVNTAQGMQTYLKSLEDGATPSVLPMLQSQLKVLQYVQSPTMTGMAIDNMIVYLNQSLKQADNDELRNNIREAFAALIQNFMFFTEATLRLAIDSNQKEARMLLEQAGEMLTDAVQMTSALITPGGKKKIGKVLIQNIFSAGSQQDSFIGNIAKWFYDKKVLESKQAQYLKTIEQLFEVFDQYADLIGPSIQVKGMLMRYRIQLVEKYESKKLNDVMLKANIIDQEKLNQFSEGVSSLIGPCGLNINSVGKSIGALLGIAVDSFNNKTEMNVKSYCMIEDSLIKQLNKLEKQAQDLESGIDELRTSHNEIGIFQRAKKKESQQRIDKIHQKLDEKESQIAQVKSKLQEIQDLFPEAHAIHMDISDYNQHLLNIEKKYAISTILND